MSEDWRLRVSLHKAGLIHALTERLEAHELEHELETTFSDRVIVSGDGGELFCYAGSREQIDAARRLVESVGEEHGWQIDFELHRWHPDEQAWKDPDIPLPREAPEFAAEHAARMEREREEAHQQGYPSFEVRVECGTEKDCDEFARRLQTEGLRVVRRSRYLLVGADDEDSANELAARLQREAPGGSAVVAEGALPAVYAGRPQNPFAVFGGLGV